MDIHLVTGSQGDCKGTMGIGDMGRTEILHTRALAARLRLTSRWRFAVFGQRVRRYSSQSSNTALRELGPSAASCLAR
ncbi:hypothetical protein [Kitasatospora indigofera]|uniref:hypothetical protein n=1 Tax=Kitasatospora indigofera TaxID=67307 RepID=UPI0033AC89AB